MLAASPSPWLPVEGPPVEIADELQHLVTTGGRLVLVLKRTGTSGCFRVAISSDRGAHFHLSELPGCATPTRVFDAEGVTLVFATQESHPVVLRSADAGATWSTAPFTRPGPLTEVVPFKGRWWVASGTSLWRSADRGRTWTATQVPVPLEHLASATTGLWAVAADPTRRPDGRVILEWSAGDAFTPRGKVPHGGVLFAQPTTLYLHPPRGVPLFSRDRARTWAPATDLPDQPVEGMSLSAEGRVIGWTAAGQVGAPGSRWISVRPPAAPLSASSHSEVPPQLRSVQRIADTTFALWVGAQPALAKATADLRSFTRQPMPISRRTGALLRAGDGALLGSFESAHPAAYLSRDDGRTWTEAPAALTFPQDSQGRCGSPVPLPERSAAEGAHTPLMAVKGPWQLSSGLELSVNGGQSWTPLAGGLPPGAEVEVRRWKEACFTALRLVVLAARSSYRRDVAGSSWTPLPVPGRSETLACEGRRVLVKTDQGLYRSDDEGATFSEVSTALNAPASGVLRRLVLHGDEVLAFASEGRGPLRSRDAGAHFEEVPLPGRGAQAPVVGREAFFAATSEGLFKLPFAGAEPPRPLQPRR